MATNDISPSGPQPKLSVTGKQIEINTILHGKENKEEETHIFQSSLGSQKPQDHNIPNLILDSFTNGQETSARKSCIVQQRESVVRKLIETINISFEKDDDPTTQTVRTSTESQKTYSSSKSHQIPACLTSWKKQKINLEEKIFGGPKNQSVLLNLTDLPNPQQTSPSTPVQPNITRPKSETEALFHCTDNRNQNESERNFSVIHGPNIPDKTKLIPIPILKIFNDKDDPTSLEAQKSHIRYPIPNTATSWRKWRDSLDKNILGSTKEQGAADLNLTSADKSESHPSSTCATMSTDVDVVKKSKTLLTRKINQQNNPANGEAIILVNSAINKAKLVESDHVPGKSEKRVCGGSQAA